MGRGRPGPSSKYKIHKTTHYSLLWEKDKERVACQKKVDGIFPFLLPIA